MNRTLPVLAISALGFSLSPAQERIVGGTKAPADTYQWITAVADLGAGALFDRQFCGGSLIAPDWVITAAHCVEDTSRLRVQVVVGLTNLNNPSSAEIRRVRGIYRHPRYADLGGDLFNDVALLLLSSPVTTIDPIPYARSTHTFPIGAQMRALGWGDTQSVPRYPVDLRMVDLNLVSTATARRVYGTSLINHRHLAAMAGGKDTCAGDSGGPLFHPTWDSGDPVLAGITSYGLRCAARGVPGIYTNVGNYAGWIGYFLSRNVAGNPSITVRGRGAAIPSGRNALSRRSGTDFGVARGGQSILRRFQIVNRGATTPLSIESVTSSTKRFTVVSFPPYVSAGRSAVMAVRYRGQNSWFGGRTRGRITIRCNDPARPAYPIRLLARHAGF